ncbi:MAG: PAS domain S-box protein [Rhodoferax sp.]|nr:PAS domain S-box protein [Rhodoferax sp.]
MSTLTPVQTKAVAIGASAGGMQALRNLFSKLIPNSQTAYIVAHHLAPDQVSNLPELLGNHSRLTISMARDGDKLLADHVYVCPPNREIAIFGCQLVVSRKDLANVISPSVNRLLTSLAAHFGSQATAIIVSGSGSDGTEGAKAIKEAGGFIIAQRPDEASQSGMPQSVIDAGYADFVGTAEQIANWLNDASVVPEGKPIPSNENETALFNKIFQLVSETAGMDITRYKETTLRRQTIRRYRSLGLSTLDAYLLRLKSDPHEIRELQQTFLISVSSFFRDKNVFAALNTSLETLIAGKNKGDSIRVWIPGCATGEEAYSIAILIAEILGDRLYNFEVRIFATDVDQSALELARSGFYTATELSQIGEERQQRWFINEGSGWRITKAIRELCVFSEHNVIAHPPFIRMDLISCRNLLIYFKPDQQRDLINTFHYSLLPGGILLLGNSESTGFHNGLFESIDINHRLYRRISGATGYSPRFARLSNPFFGSKPRLPISEATPKRRSLVETSLALLARKFGPPAVLINPSFEPLQFFGNSQRYFQLPDENIDFTVFSLCLPELRSELKALCYRLIQENLSTLDGLPQQISVDGALLRVRPSIHRVEQPGENNVRALLVCFEETRLVSGLDTPSALNRPEDPLEIARLRQELADTREHLQAVIEELESSNEELQSLNEEVQSSSEELQAANEELQASNEELTTLNDELRLKSFEATELMTTLSNIQNSIGSSLVVVDKEGRITRCNPLASRIFGIVTQDIGHFLFGVPCHLQLPKLREQVIAVIEQGGSIVERVHQGSFHFLMQIDPYQNQLNERVGAVLTFTDISELHRAENAQANSEIRFRQIWESSLEGLLVVDRNGRIVLANPSLESMFGYSTNELVGLGVENLVPEASRQTHASDRQAFQNNPSTRKMALLRDLNGQKKDGTLFPVEVSLSGMKLDDQDFVVGSVSDISVRKAGELALRESEARLRLAMDAASAGTWEWDLATNKNIWSDELWKLYGLDKNPAEPSYEIWKSCIAPEHLEATLKAITLGIENRAEFELTWRVNHCPPDNPRWLLARGRPILDASGKPARYIGIVLDITARKRAETALETHRNQLERLVEARTSELAALYNQAPCGYHSLDINGVFTGVNDTELAWLGYTRSEMIGKMTALDIMPPSLHATFRANFPKLVKNGALSGLEIEFTRKDGSVFPVLLHARAVYDQDGKFSHSLSSIIDNTDRKRAETALVHSREAAEAANRAKTAFLANMSHEIRTPLNAIIGLNNIMKRGQLDQDLLDYLGKVDHAAQHLLGIINDVLDLSKIEAEKFTLEDIPFELPVVCEKVLEMLQEKASKKALRLHLEIAQFNHPYRGDPTRITQALLNLAANAIKFTEQGTVSIRVSRIDQQADREQICFEIEDSGIGVPVDAQKRLFAAFEQADVTTTRKYGGTGLGLVITKRLAELMGGTAGLHSEPGKGSVFWFSVWLRKDLTGIKANAANGDGQDSEAILREEFAGCDVLLVEDEPVNQEVTAFFLQEAGLSVTTANDGAEALAIARERRFKLVLMDMQMPEMNGLDATRAIRKLDGWEAIPVIAMTANAFSDDRENCLSAGMNDFLTKPFEPDRFFSTLLHWLRATPGA